MNLARRGSTIKPPRKRAKSSSKKSATNSIVELVPATGSMTSSTSTKTAGPGRYAIEVHEARVEFDDDFSELTLRRVLGMLRSC
jgi:hypothetical protein